MTLLFTLKSAEKLSLSHLCVFAILLSLLTAQGLFSAPVRTDRRLPKHIDNKIGHQNKPCENQNKPCEKGCLCTAGHPGEGFAGWLNEYASFAQVQRNGATPALFPFPDTIPFGFKVGGSGEAITSRGNTSNSFVLEAGDYKISAGVSTFGVPGVQLILSINDKQVFHWPNTPTALNDTTFIEFTVIEEVPIDSILYVSVTKEIPSHPIIAVDTLVSYITIQKLDENRF